MTGVSGMSLLRFITCGSVDDGKSTLIGRLLYESRLICTDQLDALAAESKRLGNNGDTPDLALLVDGLAAEREQGITIDVAYRYFTTDRRRFIVADTPGHEQYTRNMVTGASTAELAVILVDARKGVLTQTRRHSCLVSLLGIRTAVLAVNKLDLAGYSQEVFDRIERDYRAFAATVGITDVHCVPTSALRGDNVIEHSVRTPWYDGPPLLRLLETIAPEAGPVSAFRMPVQSVIRDADFRGLAGTVSGGTLAPGDRIQVLPSRRETTVASLVGGRPEAVAGEAVTVAVTDDLDIGRGDLLCSPNLPATVAGSVDATVIWMHEQPMLPGRSYYAKVGTRTVPCTITRLRHRTDVTTLDDVPAVELALNEIGTCTLEFGAAIAFDPYRENRETGGCLIIDRLSGGTVAAALLERETAGAGDVHLQAVDIDKAARGHLNGHGACVVWLTGISGAGKSTIANLLERRLHALGKHTYLLDGDNLRRGLNRDLGFTETDRVENIRRVAEVAALMADAGLIVLAAFISPFEAERQTARNLVGADEFCEVFVDTPLEVAEQRDPKGLYRRARRGELPNFTGIDSPYEAPCDPDVRVDTTKATPEQAADLVMEWLRGSGVLGR